MMISPIERTVASFGIGFMSSFLIAVFLFFIDDNIRPGLYVLPFSLIGGILYEKYDHSINVFQKYMNYFFSFLGGLLPSIVSGF